MDKQTLMQYRQLCREIRELEEEKEALAAGNLPGSWPLGLNQLIALRREIEDFIADLQPEERRILRLYYIEGLTWEQTAERLEYSVRQINRKQRQIMQQLFPNDTEKQAS